MFFPQRTTGLICFHSSLWTWVACLNKGDVMMCWEKNKSGGWVKSPDCIIRFETRKTWLQVEGCSIIWRHWHTRSLFPTVIGTRRIFPEGLPALLSCSQKALSQCPLHSVISCTTPNFMLLANVIVSCSVVACARPIRIDYDNAIRRTGWHQLTLETLYLEGGNWTEEFQPSLLLIKAAVSWAYLL